MIMLNVFLILFLFMIRNTYSLCSLVEGSHVDVSFMLGGRRIIGTALRASDLSGDQMFVFGLQFRIGRPMNFFGWIIL